jgi:GntR family transcriptional regulator/MocR family aminotransferase
MRLGWMLTPSWLGWPLISVKAVEDRGSEVVGQLALQDFIARGELERHLRRMRQRYQRRREVLIDAVTRHLARTHLSDGAAGLFELAELPPDTNEAALVAAAAERGVGVEGLALHSFRPSSRPGLVLGFGGMPEAAIAQSVEILGEALAEQR